MIIEIKIPEVGESITEGFLAGWNKEDGDQVQVDDELFELETDKITLTVQSEHAGQLKIQVQEGSDVLIGQVVATIDTDAAGAEAAPVEKTEPAAEEAPQITPEAGKQQLEQSLQSEEMLESLSPAVRKLVVEKNLDPSAIPGTGKGGRLTKGDVLESIKVEKSAPAPAKVEAPKPVAAAPAPPKPQATPAAPKPVVDPSERQTRVPMTRLRQRISERLLMAQQNAAILTTFNEVDMSAVMDLRKKLQDIFVAKYGVKLGFMSFFIKATIEALKKVPAVNAMIDGNDIVYNNYYDIGIAVSTDTGLVVPVIRDADKMGFAEIEKTIIELGQKAREKRLTLDDLQGGTFTISNGGIFGSMMSTPILNPPQSGILGMHAIKKRAVVVEPDDNIEVRPMMYLAVSYDHRIIDGAESVTFLKHIKECLENPERIMLEI
jgi:2-oxoglutarate dehydrogenase E2 component (dihydrolipoamide succinyltransferase)